MSRDFDQIMRSRETDSWKRQWHGSIGTVVGGTLTVSITPTTGRSQQFVTNISFQSNLAGASIDIMDGTSFIFHMGMPVAGVFSENFVVPLKCSQGTQLNTHLYGIFGTHSINISGYTVE